MDDPYRILGVSRDASEDEIKKAYRTLAKKYHPDVNKDPGAEDMFIKVQNAYQQLMDNKKNGFNGNSWQNAYGGFQQNGYQQSSFSNDYQAAVNYINAGRFQEALHVLNGIQDRDASWYYLFAITNAGMGNQIAAMEAAQRACEMDPGNQQYRQFYAQLQNGRMRYQNMQSPFGAGNNDFCCRCMQIYLCMNCCGGGVFCC